MKKFIFNLIFILLVSIGGYSQTLTTPTSQEVPVGVNGVGISGFSLDGYNSSTTYKVSLSITGNANATFSVNTTTGLTRDYGFNSWTNITMVNFMGKPSDIQNGLNSIKFNTSSTVDGLINLSVVISTQLSNTYYNPTNGHMYKFVSGNVSYASAKTSAGNSTFEGESGYLVTITSADEQSFVQSKVYGNNIWIALSDEAVEGTWKIDDGPEEGTTVWTASQLPAANYKYSYSSAGTTASGQYSNWSNGEPNNSYSSYGEDHAVMKWSGGTGWNDLYKSYPWGIGGYVIEYGDWTDPTQSTFNSTQQTQITFTQKDMLWVDYTFDFGDNIDPTDFSGKMYYEESESSWATNNTTNLTLNSLGKVNTTNQIQEETLGKKATTVGGQVEWCVLYDYDNTNKRHRILIDKREFPSGVSASDVKKLQLFDLWDGDVTYHTDDAYWAQYYIYTDTQFNFSNSSYSSYIRDANGFYGMKAEFSFEDAIGYKPHSFIFTSPTQTEIETLIDDIVTVSDVVLAFNELSGGGINGGYKGDLNGIQLGNADVNGDNNFDFQDTYKLLEYLTGTNSLVQSTNTLVYFMKIKSKSDWDGTTTSNWKSKYNGTTLMADVDLDNGLVVFPQYNVTWLGDVNLSHSPTIAGAVTTAKSSPRIMLSQYKENSVDITFDIEIQNTETKTWVDDKIIVTLTIPENQQNISGSEFRIAYDNTRVTYDKVETNSNLQNFDVQRTNYIKLGSISTDGSKNLNGGVEYKIYFSPQQSFNSILGLVSVIKSELVTTNGIQIESIFK